MLSMICRKRRNRPRRRRGLRLATFAGGATWVRGWLRGWLRGSVRGWLGGWLRGWLRGGGVACGDGETGRLVAFTGGIGRVSVRGGAGAFAGTAGAVSNRGFAVAT